MAMITIYGEDNWEIVRLECEDWQIYRDLSPHFQNPLGKHFNDREFFLEDLECEDTWHLAIIVDGEPVGSASAFLNAKNKIYMDQLFVLETHRNQGFAKKLHDARLNIAAENTSAKLAEIDVSIDNAIAIKALNSMGFQPYPEDQQTPSKHYIRYYYDLNQRRQINASNTPQCSP